MATLSISARSSLCASCIRRISWDDISQLWFPFHRQLRGKKKSAKRPTTINVKLLEDIVGFGRKGSICPVEPGRMRNTWYPRQKAEYMTTSTIQGLKPQNLVAERDFTFGMKPKEEPIPQRKASEKERVVEIQTRLLLPQRASEIIEASLPPSLVFYRTPIAATEPYFPFQEPTSRSRRVAASSAAAELEAASQPLPKPQKPQVTTIFGSVSTTDIAESMKAVLAGSTEGARVVFGAENITIFQDEDDELGHQDKGIEEDRLKALGDFRVEVRVKGGEPVIRTVSIKAEEASQA
ncbi:hypothetical protein IMSHALPRED_003427 [Imshaugia aleurites]|uniref:Ribosomal protein L9 domain-containing protein n=1 Tax=Imshaugia aleurites TaxID=172621 RepID=A0A8H3J870_9LECA|nr:hypothetical protein IMSHALPRED_003427 [Imshaugia aleurites]